MRQTTSGQKAMRGAGQLHSDRRRLLCAVRSAWQDDPVMGASLQQRLELEGYRTAWWQSGGDAVAAIKRQPPDS